MLVSLKTFGWIVRRTDLAASAGFVEGHYRRVDQRGGGVCVALHGQNVANYGVRPIFDPGRFPDSPASVIVAVSKLCNGGKTGLSKRIAIVEDEVAIRENYAAAFRREGYAVDCYEAKEPAMEAFATRLPDLVVIDVNLKDDKYGRLKKLIVPIQ
jgi:hypothetical protein